MKIVNILVEKLDMSLRFHNEVGLQLSTFREEGYVAVEDVYLLTLLADKRHAPPYGESAYQDTARDGRHDRHKREPRFLFK